MKILIKKSRHSNIPATTCSYCIGGYLTLYVYYRVTNQYYSYEEVNPNELCSTDLLICLSKNNLLCFKSVKTSFYTYEYMLNRITVKHIPTKGISIRY